MGGNDQLSVQVFHKSLQADIKPLSRDGCRYRSGSSIITTLLIHPQVMTDFLDFHFLLAEADALIRNLGFEGVFQIASLHPRYEFAGSEADDIANFTNRSPYPTLHILRESSIDRAVAAFPDAESIFERNIETMERLGHEGWKKLWLS